MAESLVNIGIAGATGVVGGTVRAVLEERHFPVGELRLLASAHSQGRQLAFNGRNVTVQTMDADSFAGLDLVFFAAGGAVSKQFALAAVAAGATVIDKSSTFRMDPEVPLVVPEVNADMLAQHKGIIATPNCSTIQMVVALKPIYDAVGLRRVVVSTYQAVSGAGQKGVAALTHQSAQAIAGEPVQAEHFARQIAFNALPQIGTFLPSGYTTEEQKMVDETHKIFADASIAVAPTCVRVPVYDAHSESLNIETRRKLSAGAARELLTAAAGVVVVDDPGELQYPTPLDAAGRDAVFVGRLRADDTVENGLAFWCVSDNLRKGAALNAVQIAEELVRRHLL
ncbi:MAG: aspartate-semialdehyde dehydrogenase [Thermoleophilia bacterium]